MKGKYYRIDIKKSFNKYKNTINKKEREYRCKVIRPGIKMKNCREYLLIKRMTC